MRKYIIIGAIMASSTACATIPDNEYVICETEDCGDDVDIIVE